MTWEEAFGDRTIARRDELVACGATSRGLTAAVRFGHLIRVRRDHYALPGTPEFVLQAVRVGGRVACISALRLAGVFALDHKFVHVHVERDASRLRSPRSRRMPLDEHNRDGVQLHWSPLVDPDAGTEAVVGIIDALGQAVRCQPQWLALASIDNALHQGKVSRLGIADLFAVLPARFASLAASIEPRSEAGQETVLRMAFLAAGLRVEVQVVIPGVGRVDFVIEGRLVVEADSRLAHDGWELHVRDRDRDIDCARLGYMSLRPAYNRTMYATAEVVQAVVALLAATDPLRGS